ncbi:YopT-type cysteine protease domain-containing protein [Legionella impletisoli]|uniref:Peptidase C58 YopT-type domain-containing protein n=1 Tax=Legionella impletisoli TaxID=343510 RepID=A0A917JYL7_9GAMM|nr:YopT-type cysteine protease domain-containing protein [Legionella impletisoli]GGI92472.1 hypothetical protein GCM10007966_21400 [Legionella impletisoli]
MSINLGQGQVIDNLNRYLEWHNLPLRMNKEGICNGLAMVYVKYVLENKEKEFFDMLGYIAGKEISSEMEIQVNHFVNEVILSFIPEKYDKKLNQSNAIKALAIDNKSLKSSFDLALVTSDDNWANIFTSLSLRENEVMRVASINHTVAVAKKEGQYIVYDPNYSSGFKTFANEKQLVQELHKNVFEYNRGPLGLEVSVICHPDSPARDFPKLKEIYHAYLTHENITQVAKTDGKKFDTLQRSAILNDAAAISELLSIGAKDDNYQAAAEAVMSNNPDTLRVLLENIKEPNVINGLFVAALEHGRSETFDELLQHSFSRTVIENAAKMNLNKSWLINKAAEGGNVEVLQKTIQLCQTNLGTEDLLSPFILEKQPMEDAICAAIRGGDVKSVELLMEHLEKEGFDDPIRNVQYLTLAIRENQPYMVALLLKKIPSEFVQTISMTASATEKTDLFIIHQLQKHDVNFSTTAKAIIDKKEHRPVGIILSIGIMLNKFSDFCKEKLLNKAGVDHNVQACKTIQAKLANIQHEALESEEEPNSGLSPK